MKKRLPLIIIESLALVAVLASVAYCFIAGSYQNTRLTPVTEKIRSYYDINGVRHRYEDLPVNLRANAGEEVKIVFRLPENVKDGYSICYLALYSKSEVYLGSRLIGSYGTKLPLSFGRMQGNIRVLVPVDRTMAGQELTLVIVPYYDAPTMDISPILLGETGELKFEIVRNSIPKLIILVTLTIIAIISAALLIDQLFEKSGINVRLFGNFILLDIFVASWLFFSSDLPQLLTSANTAVSFASFLCLACVATPFAGYCEQTFLRRANIFYLLQIVGWILPIANIFCFVTNIADPFELLPITHIYIVFVLVLSLICAIIEPKKTTETYFFLSGFVLLAVASAGGFVCYFIAPSKGYDGIFFGAGFVFFVAFLFFLILARQVGLIRERQNLSAYRKLAYSNVITGLKNQAAFDEEFANMKLKMNEGEPVTLFLLNVVNHHTIVENHGHQAGDNALKIVGQNLEKVFGNYGDCYHFGGDEFAVIIESTAVDVRKLKSAFEGLTAQTRFMYDTPLVVPLGYATLPFSLEEEIREKLMDRASAAMQEEKKRINAINSL